MMKNRIKPVIVILLAIVVLGGGYWFYRQNPDTVLQLQRRVGLLGEAQASEMHTVTGYIEADEINLAAETSGRIIRITVDEGDLAQRDQILVELDTALLEADVRQAKARISTAQAQLAKIKAGVRAEEIAKVEAAVAVADAAAEAAYTGWQDAIRLRDNPQELDRQVDAARTAAELAKLRIDYSVPLKDAGEALWELGQHNWEYAHERHRFCVDHPIITGEEICVTRTFPEGEKRAVSTAWNYAGADMWEAWVDLNGAVAERGDAQTALNDLLRLRNDPQEAQIRVAQAEASYKTALAEVEVAKAGLKILKAGPRAEQIAVAESQVRQAEASLRALNVQRDKHTLVAPLAGWVVEQSAQAGEMAVPGATLLTLADLANVTLTVYVPEPDVDTVSIGQNVTVFVDTFPDTPFTGYVTYISDEAEFTPKNIQTREERTTTVFAVKIKLENEDQQLKPGMPADAVLPEGLELSSKQ
jgi:multidrug efflux pump subunit AcrA (membrane-fusion protein)